MVDQLHYGTPNTVTRTSKVSGCEEYFRILRVTHPRDQRPCASHVTLPRRCGTTYSHVSVSAKLSNNHLRPMVPRHPLIPIGVPPDVGDPPEQVFLLLPTLRAVETPQQSGVQAARRKLGSEDLVAPAFQGAGFVFHVDGGSHTQGLTRISRKCNKFAQFVLKVWVS